ncbi:hypothetical protein OSSY52_08760 [Tepiditoga spiralis]|uniref:sucrose-phosphate synthase n=1 Tax=Tepiditoga spiralis TaxID=2108365 RepID=A0A7G1G3U8_9BACT|nr:glycosyltransferase [Tepiditoga spiralis]BBE30735.1 hypothetical protein OSSY52_08760 [Tepiditoga spiralis]
MRVAFLNPQGNFDEKDSHLTEHSDFGGQLIYVKEVAMALSKMGIDVDIITRKIEDEEWPEFSKSIDRYEGYNKLRIIRLPFGGKKFLNKEQLWDYIPQYVDEIIKFYGNKMPDFFTAHYGDGGYAGVLLKQKTGINFSFTGHSLGAQKLEKLGMNMKNFETMDKKYHFSKRISAERYSMKYASKIITSTNQERSEQYSHYLYRDSINVEDKKFKIIPPGVNLKIFNTELESLNLKLKDKKPHIILSSRLDEKKNHLNVVKAYASSKKLQDLSNLSIFLRNIENPYDLKNISEKERNILEPIISIIRENNIEDKVFFFDLKSQKDLAGAYRYFAQLNSVFSLTAFYEPFGLAPIEAAACGLAIVATKNGGPSEIFEDGSGVLVDPFDVEDIKIGLLNGIKNAEKYKELGRKRVLENYTWEKTAKNYLIAIEEGMKENININDQLELNSYSLIKSFLKLKMEENNE